MTRNNLEESLAKNGWLVVDLPDPTSVFQVQKQLLSWLREQALPDLSGLEQYHLLVDDRQQHLEILHNLSSSYWQAELGQKIITANLNLFQQLIGPDLVIQRYPYLRVVRPGQEADAVPLHRDTYYGASPYEISILIPFTNMEAEAALKVITSSHLAPDSEYPYIQQVSPDVTIGSSQHQLGWAYAPRLLEPHLLEQAESISLKVGQVLIFGLSLVHGAGVNRSQCTRFSSDIRLANSLAPVKWTRGVHKDYFVPLHKSVISQIAEHYLINRKNTTPTTASLKVKCIDPTEDPAWHSLLAHPEAGIFHSPPWFRALADAYGFVIRAYVVTDTSDAVLGGIPFCEIDDLIAHRIIALPFTDVCDPLVSSSDVWKVLLNKLQSHEVSLELRFLKDSLTTDEESFKVTRSKRWHHLSIEESQELLWSRMTSSNQRAIRVAQRAGIEVRPLVGAEGWEGFLRLHVALRKQKFRLLAQPSSFFEALAQRFSEVDGWHPLGAFLDGQLIAATIYLRWGDTLYYKFNASEMNALQFRPNNLLIWAGMLLGQSLGCRILDLGPSDDDQPGLIRFKRNFGVEERHLRFLRWTPTDFQSNDNNPLPQLLSDLTSLLTSPNVPDEIAMQAGALLYRFFS